MKSHRLGRGDQIPFRLAQQQVANDVDGAYVLDLVERHGMDLRAAAREAKLPVKELRALLREHTRTWFLARVRAFYGDQLALATARQVAEHLQSLELALAAG